MWSERKQLDRLRNMRCHVTPQEGSKAKVRESSYAPSCLKNNFNFSQGEDLCRQNVAERRGQTFGTRYTYEARKMSILTWVQTHLSCKLQLKEYCTYMMVLRHILALLCEMVSISWPTGRRRISHCAASTLPKLEPSGFLPLGASKPYC